jgi:Tfp pilus assembly protein PilF
MQSDDLHGADEEFSKAVHLKPEYAEAHYNLALVLQKEGKQGEARAELEKAYEIEPGLKDAQQQ